MRREAELEYRRLRHLQRHPPSSVGWMLKSSVSTIAELKPTAPAASTAPQSASSNNHDPSLCRKPLPLHNRRSRPLLCHTLSTTRARYTKVSTQPLSAMKQTKPTIRLVRAPLTVLIPSLYPTLAVFAHSSLHRGGRGGVGVLGRREELGLCDACVAESRGGLFARGGGGGAVVEFGFALDGGRGEIGGRFLGGAGRADHVCRWCWGVMWRSGRVMN